MRILWVVFLGGTIAGCNLISGINDLKFSSSDPDSDSSGTDGTDSDSGASECDNGDTRRGEQACGVKLGGVFIEQCVAGHWEQTAVCDDPDASLPPTITGIDGDGTNAPIVAPAGMLDGVLNRLDAGRRFQNGWWITGTQLSQVTQIAIEQAPQAGGALFVLMFDEGGTTMRRRVTLPSALATGLLTVTLTNPHGDATAQVYVLQGEKGDPGATGPRGEAGDSQLVCANGTCTLGYNLTVNGDLAATSGDFDEVGVDALVVNQSVWLPASLCPRGYTHDATATGIVLCKKGSDEVVKVGDFWIDRYEASVWSSANCTGTQYGTASDDYGSAFPDNGNWTTKLYACSKTGVMPARHVTWFQAVQACELSGKHLCTNEEWQAAAAGTHDPGASGTGTQCLISGTAPRNTGLAGTTPAATTTCVSRYGAQDMIGNLFEKVTLWGEAGLTYLTGTSPIIANPWPDNSYGGDAVVNLNSAVFVKESTAANGAPAAAVRGGGYTSGANAGVFNFAMNTAPSASGDGTGLRCCLNY